MELLKWDRVVAMILGFDNMNTNVVRWPSSTGGEDYSAISDYWKVYRFFPLSLATGAAAKPSRDELDLEYTISTFLDI